MLKDGTTLTQNIVSGNAKAISDIEKVAGYVNDGLKLLAPQTKVAKTLGNILSHYSKGKKIKNLITSVLGIESPKSSVVGEGSYYLNLLNKNDRFGSSQIYGEDKKNYSNLDPIPDYAK